MAATVISDVIVPSVFAPYVQLLTSQRSAFVRSGVLVMDPRVDELLVGGGRTFDMPFFNDLVQTESNVSSDTGTATPLNITTGREIAIRHNRNQVWGSFDLAAALAGADPLEAIASRVATYWILQQQAMVIRSIRGLIADNIAADAGDMVRNVTAGAGAVSDANRFSADEFINAVQTMGDRGENLSAVAVHSVVYRRMQKLDLIDFIVDSLGGKRIPVYQGREVIVDDSLPVVANGANFEFSTYLFARGALAGGVGAPKVPVEVERQPLAGLGGGSENLHSRVEWAIHPVGFAWISGSMAGQSPTFAELILAANWDRRVDRKLAGIAELRTNG